MVGPWRYAGASAALWAAYVQAYFLWYWYLKSLASSWQLLVGAVVVPVALTLRILRGYCDTKYDSEHAGLTATTFTIVLLGATCILNLWWLSSHLQYDGYQLTFLGRIVYSGLALFFDSTVWFLIISAVAMATVQYIIERKLRNRGDSIADVWRRQDSSQQTRFVAFLLMVMIVISGTTIVFVGYGGLTAQPSYYYPYYPYFRAAQPQYTNYTGRFRNLSIEVNVTQSTYSPAFVVGDTIAAQVVMTALNVSSTYPIPILKKITFPSPDNWSFYYQQSGAPPSGDWSLGNQITAEGSRIYPSPGTYRLVDNWTVTNGMGTNLIVPVFLNLTVYGRDAIAAYQNQQEQALQVYLQMFVEQRQEAYNLVLVGFSLIFVASLVPEMSKLIVESLGSRRRRRDVDEEIPHAPPT